MNAGMNKSYIERIFLFFDKSYFGCFLGTFGAFFRFAVLIFLKQRIIILDTEESNSGQLDVENYNSLRQELLISATRITNFYFRPSTKLLNSL